jgi:hypothetical protein
MSEHYSHRNGETEPPREMGWYWLSDITPAYNDVRMISPPGIVEIKGDQMYFIHHSGTAGTAQVNEVFGKWWGPIAPPPWEQDAI